MISTVLLFISIPILAVYFYQFSKTMNVLDDGEKRRYVEKAGSKMGLAITILLFGSFFYFNRFDARVAIAVGIVVVLVAGTYWHHRKLKKLNFPPAFESRLLKVSALSVIGTILILASFLLDSHAT